MLMQNNTAAKHIYRADIDGLRAIAVVAVIIYHAFPHAVPGGFLGVDIFFVISGYLITGIILRDIKAGQFSLLAFYQSRIRRIYPALILVLIASLAAGLILLMPTQFQRLGWHVAGSALFVPNLMLWSESGYFDTSSLSKPLLHLWSLGVEEQFYLIWPLLLWWSARLRLQLLVVLAAIIAASFAYNVHLLKVDPTAAFYSPLSRAWELAAGAILASSPLNILPDRARAMLCGLGIVLVAAAVVSAQEASSTLWHTVMAVIGAGMLIACGPDNWLSRMALSTRPFVAIGLISYPLYLWHWPILVFARQAFNQSILSTVILMAIAGALATFTYRLVERPIRQKTPSKVAIPLFVSLAVLGAFGAGNSQVDVRSFFYPEKMREILAFSNYDFKSDAQIGTCWLSDPTQTYSEECSLKAGGTLPRIAVWGDSHAGRFLPGLALAAEGKARVAGYSADSCPPVRNIESCRPFVEGALSSLIRSSPDIVILYAWWSHYSKTYAPGSPIVTNINATIDELERAGIKVVIVGPFPEFPGKLPDVILQQWLSDKSKGIPESVPEMPTTDIVTTEAELRALANERHLDYVSLTEMFCKERACVTSWSTDPADLLTWDYGHLTTEAARHVGTLVLKRILR